MNPTLYDVQHSLLLELLIHICYIKLVDDYFVDLFATSLVFLNIRRIERYTRKIKDLDSL